MASYTRGEAAGLLAAALGAPAAKDWLTGWSSNEIQCGVGCSHPQNNLWACGQAAPGATDWNSAGVKNYPSLSEAIVAMAANLSDSHYPAYQLMVDDLRQGIWDSGNIRAGLSTWCGSTCYSNSAGQFISEGQAHSGDQFDDSGGTVPAGAPLLGLGCVKCGPAQLECCSPMVCQNGLCVLPSTAAATQATQNAVAGLLPSWLTTPNWPLLGKVLVGAVLLIFGAFLIGHILTGGEVGRAAGSVAKDALAIGAA